MSSIPSHSAKESMILPKRLSNVSVTRSLGKTNDVRSAETVDESGTLLAALTTKNFLFAHVDSMYGLKGSMIN